MLLEGRSCVFLGAFFVNLSCISSDKDSIFVAQCVQWS